MLSTRRAKFYRLVREANDQPSDWLADVLQDKTRNNGHMEVVLIRPEHRTQYEPTDMVVRGEVDHLVGNAETPAGLVRVLENALNRMDKALESECEYLFRTEKRMADLAVEIAKTYDKGDRLTWLQQRQKEINAALDLSKGDVAAAEEAEALEAA